MVIHDELMGNRKDQGCDVESVLIHDDLMMSRCEIKNIGLGRRADHIYIYTCIHLHIFIYIYIHIYILSNMTNP